MSSLRWFGLMGVGLGLGTAAVAYFTGCGGNAFTAGTTSTGTTEDGGASSDGGGTGGPGADGSVDAGPGFCASLDASQFPFCSDFDEKALPENWSGYNAPSAATLSEDPDASASPPNSLLAIAPAQELLDGGATVAFVTKSGLPKGAVHIAFDVKVDQIRFPNESSSISSVIPLVYTQGKNYELFLAFTPSTTTPFALALVEVATSPLGVGALGDAGTTVTGHDLSKLLVQPSITSWLPMHLDFDLDHDGGVALSVSASVSLGQVSTQITLNPPLGTSAGERALTLGIEAVGETGQAVLRYDNVTYGTQ